MRNFLLASLFALTLVVSCNNPDKHGNPPADLNSEPKDFDTTAAGQKDTLVLPH